jgi:PST family polysaccharide transporter
MNWSQQGCLALTAFILGALLGPESFGMVAMATVYILFVQMFLEQGFVAAIIQRKNLTPEHLDAVFWLICASSFCLMGLSVAFSGWWAHINQLPALGSVISVLSFSIPLTGSSKVHEALLKREMDFRSLAIRAGVSISAGASLAIVMALAGFGVWALVAQHLCREAISTILLWKFSPWRPRFQCAIRASGELLGFSTGNFVAKLGVFTSMQVDTLLVGLFFGPLAAGLYRMAERITTLVLEVTSTSLAVVSFPEFSKIQWNHALLRERILLFLRTSALVTIPLMATIAAMSNLIMQLLGPKWTATSNALRVMCLYGIVYALVQFTGPILQATSRPFLLALLTWGQGLMNILILITLGFYLENSGTSNQIVGIAFAKLCLTAFFWIPISSILLLRKYQVPLRDVLGVIGPSFCAAIGAILAGSGASSMFVSMKLRLPAILALVFGIAASLSAVFIILTSIDSELRHRIARFLQLTVKLSPAKAVKSSDPQGLVN